MDRANSEEGATEMPAWPSGWASAMLAANGPSGRPMRTTPLSLGPPKQQGAVVLGHRLRLLDRVDLEDLRFSVHLYSDLAERGEEL